MAENPTFYKPEDLEKRRLFLESIIWKYENDLEPEDFRALMGLDLITQDTDGNTFTSEYELNIETGLVDRTINETMLPNLKIYINTPNS